MSFGVVLIYLKRYYIFDNISENSSGDDDDNGDEEEQQQRQVLKKALK